MQQQVCKNLFIIRIKNLLLSLFLNPAYSEEMGIKFHVKIYHKKLNSSFFKYCDSNSKLERSEKR